MYVYVILLKYRIFSIFIIFVFKKVSVKVDNVGCLGNRNYVETRKSNSIPHMGM